MPAYRRTGVALGGMCRASYGLVIVLRTSAPFPSFLTFADACHVDGPVEDFTSAFGVSQCCFCFI